MKKTTVKKKIILSVATLFSVGAFIVACSKSSGTSSDSDSALTRAIDAYQTVVASVTSPWGGTCNKVTRDTSSCQSAREALGLSGDWLSFSCNVT